MKKYTYTVGHVIYNLLKFFIPLISMAIVFTSFMIPKENFILGFIVILFFSIFLLILILVYTYFSDRPDISGEWIIDEKKGIIEMRRPKVGDNKYKISEIEEIRYSREGLLYLKLKNHSPLSFLYFKISEEERDNFEKEMKKLSEKYGFTFIVLWKRRDVDTGKSIDEIIKERSKKSGSRR